ncbi:DUF6177 family protein [Streptomyces mirabilis]|uniref:DUF6177 family protein n=1 Tax=Streptomyces mirabilis TaxID=68239 RepID=UPI0036F0F805
MTLTLGYSKTETPPLDAIASLAQALAAENGLTTMLTSLRRARRDLTVPPCYEAPPIPAAFTLGTDEIKSLDLARALHPPLSLRPAQLGPASAPALHYSLGDGTDPQAWTALQQLTQHLQTA